MYHYWEKKTPNFWKPILKWCINVIWEILYNSQAVLAVKTSKAWKQDQRVFLQNTFDTGMEVEPPSNLQPKWFPCKTGQKWIFSKGVSKNWEELNPDSLIREQNSWERKKYSHHNSVQNPHTLRAKSRKRLKIFVEGSFWGKVLLEMFWGVVMMWLSHIFIRPLRKKAEKTQRWINKAAIRLLMPGKVV